MLRHTYSTPVERALENLRENDYAEQPLAMDGLFSTNARFAQRAAALYIPEGHPIGALVSPVLGDDFMLAVVANASYLRRWAGTELAIERVAQMAGVGQTYSVVGDDVTFSVRPRAGSAEFTPSQLNFLTSVFQTVTPFYLDASIAEIIDEFTLSLYATGGLNLVDVIARSD